jgi:hypothetical protein
MKGNGYTIYDGPSMLNGRPIVDIVTGYAVDSGNEKMGRTPLQTWILPRDLDPLDATRTGEDAAVCGDCPHRGKIVDGRNVGRSCYVEVHFGVRNVWLAWKRGNYPDRFRVGDIVRLGHSRTIRLGSYGDPAAVPFWVWRSLTHASAWSMGYTRQWRTCHSEFSRLCMASVESEEERAEAKALGWRTFRVRTAEARLGNYEIICPASAEAGKRTTCENCRACSGTDGKARADVAIIAHGAIGRIGNFNRRSGVPPVDTREAA